MDMRILGRKDRRVLFKDMFFGDLGLVFFGQVDSDMNALTRRASSYLFTGPLEHEIPTNTPPNGVNEATGHRRPCTSWLGRRYSADTSFVWA